MSNVLTPGIRFIVTSLCNYDCDYCHNEWEPKEGLISKLEEKLVRELISAARELGAREVDITGGEPLLKIDRVEAILRTANDFGLWTNLTTNGYFLDRYGERLAELGLSEMHIHIPSLNPTLYRQLMKGNADLDKVLVGFKKFRGLIDTLKINVPIKEGVNDNEILSFIKYFGRMGTTTRLIEMMTTTSYSTNGQQVFDELVKRQIGGEVRLKGSYLWGINEYETADGEAFETLRCICFDRKCDICPSTNFIHVDQNYKIRPCNLRSFKIQAIEGKCSESLMQAIEFLEQKTDIPDEYKNLWGKTYVPLSIK